jgi:Arc/MetJ-type ribon-helix-helix transcriptional regulator
MRRPGPWTKVLRLGVRSPSGCVETCETGGATFRRVRRSIHVRLDDQSAAALQFLTSDGVTDSDAVRLALLEAAERRSTRTAIRADVVRLASDPVDRAEMQAIRARMAALAPREPGE